ncbi:hypothetical protein BgiBS90_015294 [Biomphalaria glabrata]|nr:hypothetical protein BgiBS90_015294 [Biomphalaria glabrata]
MTLKIKEQRAINTNRTPIVPRAGVIATPVSCSNQIPSPTNDNICCSFSLFSSDLIRCIKIEVIHQPEAIPDTNSRHVDRL